MLFLEVNNVGRESASNFIHFKYLANRILLKDTKIAQNFWAKREFSNSS